MLAIGRHSGMTMGHTRLHARWVRRKGHALHHNAWRWTSETRGIRRRRGLVEYPKRVVRSEKIMARQWVRSNACRDTTWNGLCCCSEAQEVWIEIDAPSSLNKRQRTVQGSAVCVGVKGCRGPGRSITSGGRMREGRTGTR